MNTITIGYNAQFMQAVCTDCGQTLQDLNKQNVLLQAICKQCWEKLPPDLRSDLEVPLTRMYFVRDFSK